MLRRISAVLGIGLVILWIVGLGSPEAERWLVWLDGAAALCAFGIAGMAPEVSTRASRVGSTFALSAGLYALWIIGLATDATRWMCWWNFAFACAFLLTGLSASREERAPLAVAQSELDRERERLRRTG